MILLRDGPTGLETLLLCRNRDLAFGAGAWVFPGGRVDPGDFPPDRPDDEETAARRAAVREAHEEAGLLVEPDGLVPFSHWTPPAHRGRRFSTWFFVGRAVGVDPSVTIDGGEIVDHLWVAPSEGLGRHRAGEIELLPPTWITLHELGRSADVAGALAAAAASPPELFETKIAAIEGGVAALYHGDAGYEDADATRPGPRHRLEMLGRDWRYVRD